MVDTRAIPMTLCTTTHAAHGAILHRAPYHDQKGAIGTQATRIRAVVIVTLLVSCWTCVGWAQTLRVVRFNVESGGARPNVVDDLMSEAQGVDLWGFSEVQDAIWATMFAQAAAEGETGTFAPILGTTGGGDRLLIVYRVDRFDLVRSFELADINVGGSVRAPLVAQLRLKPAGPEFLFMVNHLYRSNTERRHEQARLLNAWARSQTFPVIAVGDYNFDWDVSNGDTVHDRGYDLLIADGVLTWIRPPQLIRTQCSFNSVLDFVFVAGAARQWRTSSEILATQESYCPSDQNRSDHRPVLAMFELAPDGQPTPRSLVLAQIQRLEADLSTLKALVERVPE